MSLVRIVFIAALSLILTGCDKPLESMSSKNEPSAKPNGVGYSRVQVFFATDRNLTGDKNPAIMFGGKRSNITYGACEVSIPRDHRMGELESPYWRVIFKEDPEKHVVLLNTDIISKDKFFTDIAARVHQSKKSTALIFVHGYNVTFEDAARRTAQMTYDLGFDGAPAFYSWPSLGNEAAYTIDEDNIEWAEANLRNFLDDYFTRSDAQHVYLIAHSMGSRALTRAVASLFRDKPALKNRLQEVILAAPDIDADVFKRDIAPALTSTGRPVTLYASSNDLALSASQRINGYPRAGDSGKGLVIVPGIETIDATNVDTNLLHHSYFADTKSILSDMFYLINDDSRANDRFCLRPIDVPPGRYWEIKR
ncbi:alpha/beta fold hydrolase [Escherichia coli]|nr:alpha/beta fold hydrolase [Escherichia coli]